MRLGFTVVLRYGFRGLQRIAKASGHLQSGGNFGLWPADSFPAFLTLGFSKGLGLKLWVLQYLRLLGSQNQGSFFSGLGLKLRGIQKGLGLKVLGLCRDACRVQLGPN